MERQDEPDPRKAQILPVVRYSATRKAEKDPDYWDYATLLELAVLADDREDAQDKLSDATGIECEAWMLESTVRNLGLIGKERAARGEDAAWITDLESELLQKAARLTPPPKAGLT
jgi:MAP3K TRAFs-binding domain